ncbi:hypothetical protein D3C71_1353930 [compost metagenome]
MGDIAHRVGARGHRQAEDALTLGHVEQFVFHAVGTGTGVEHAASHQVILLERAPGRVLHFTATGRALDDLRLRQVAELAGTVQIRADHRRHIGLRRTGRTLIRHRDNGDRQCRGVAADDVDFQALLLRHGRKRQQQGSEGDQPARQFLH